MSTHDENVQAIVDYFKSGIKAAGEAGRLGIEIEHIVVDEHSRAVSYSGDYGVKWTLEQLASKYSEKSYGDNGALIGLARENKTISLEPAAQLELSAGPYEYAAELQSDYSLFQREFNSAAGAHGRRAVAIGYHPTAKAEELELIPKQRYRFMDEHFAKIGPFGRCMMRGSAATQVSIDYYSAEDCLRKMRLASVLAPLLSLLCDNSPIFEGAPRTHHMVRTEIWQNCDPARCNTVPGILDKGFTLEDYAEYLLRTPAIFGTDNDGHAFATEESFDELYAKEAMNTADIEYMLSLFFNDARLKTYIEIRPADSMPVPFAMAYATLLKGLFYYDESLDALDELFTGIDLNAVDSAKNALMASGYDAQAYGRPVGELIDELFRIAHEVLPRMDGGFMIPLSQLAQSRKTLAMLAEGV